MNLKQLRKEILTSLRGSFSQSYLNRRLGYTYNVVSKWESGHKRLLWLDFVQICEVLNIPLPNLLKRYFCYAGKPNSSADLIKHLLGDQHDLKDLALKLDRSEVVIKRWLNHLAQPYLEDVLALIDLKGELPHFSKNLVGGSQLPSLDHLYTKYANGRELFYNHPKTPALLAYLELAEYKKLKEHKKGALSEKLDISAREEEQILNSLTELGLIRFHQGKYIIINKNINTGSVTREDFFKSRDIKKHWIHESLKMIKKETPESKKMACGYQVFACSKQTRDQIRKELKDCYYRIVDLISHDPAEEKETINVFNFQLLDYYLQESEKVFAEPTNKGV